jgi:predicted TIM-barrel fold metal-dependent hydrolase
MLPVRHILRPYLPADYLADVDGAVEVAGWVHVEAGWDARGSLAPVDETRWVDGLAAASGPGIAALVANADLTLGEEVAEVLHAHGAASTRLRGIRDLIAWHPSRTVLDTTLLPERSRSAAFREGFEQLAVYGLTFETTCYSEQLAEVAELARAYPDQRIILCHAGTPVGIGGAFGDMGQTAEERGHIRGRWEEGLAALAAHPNAVVKLSGLTMPVCGFGFERRDGPPSVDEVVDAIGPLVDTIIGAFGPDRCMFGSNFPVEKPSVPLATLLNSYVAITGGRGVEETERLFSGTAVEMYRLPTSRRGYASGRAARGRTQRGPRRRRGRRAHPAGRARGAHCWCSARIGGRWSR